MLLVCLEVVDISAILDILLQLNNPEFYAKWQAAHCIIVEKFYKDQVCLTLK